MEGRGAAAGARPASVEKLLVGRLHRAPGQEQQGQDEEQKMMFGGSGSHVGRFRRCWILTDGWGQEKSFRAKNFCIQTRRSDVKESNRKGANENEQASVYLVRVDRRGTGVRDGDGFGDRRAEAELRRHQH
jgi:hypothetical protein